MSEANSRPADAPAATAEAPRARLRPSLAWRYTRWELRGSLGRVVYWVLCLAVGVSAVVSIAALASSLDGAIRHEARSLLAADLAISSQADLGEELARAVAELPGGRSAELRETVGLVARSSRTPGEHGGARSLLAELRSIDGPYPFYGEVELEVLPRDGAAERVARTSAELPLAELFVPLGDGDERPGVLAASDLLNQLGLEIGDDLLVGRARTRIAGVLIAEPDRVPGLLSVGPAVLLGAEAFEQSGLGGFGNFSRRKTLIALEDSSTESIAAARQTLQAVIGDDPSYRVETYEDAQPLIREGLEDLEEFLGLVALLSLLVGGVGIAQGVRTWLSSRLDAIAVLKCIGMRPRELFALYLGQAVFLGLIGSVIGGVIGLLGVLLVPIILAGLVPPDAIRIWQPLAFLRGIVLGVGTATAFALPPLLSVLRVPPSRVFRRDAEPLPGSRALDALVLVALVVAVTALASWQAGSLRIGAFFFAGVALTVALIGLGNFALTRLAQRLATERRSFWLRQGLAAVGRPGGGTLGALTALGLGLLVLLTMALVQEHVQDELAADLPTDAPSAFLINIENEQWPEIARILEEGGASRIDSAPVVMARIASIDDRPADELAEEREARWAFRRELRLTYQRELPADNRVLRQADPDALWGDPRPEVSVEEEFAREIGVDVGSELTLQTGGETFDLVVSSIREVDWQTFGINFFLVVEPGVLEAVPQSRLAAARLPDGGEQRIQDAVAQQFPNVTVFRIRQLLDRVVGLMRQLSFGMRVLGSFTILAGLAILAGAVATSSAQRGRQVALLKTLGMARADVLRVFGTEYALVGAVAATVATLGSLVLAWFAITRGFEIEWTWRPLLLAGSFVGAVSLAVTVGLLASRRALRVPPVEILREN
ncbi:MAG: hypothetical protein DWQ30_00970 [Acidobacteria bacterium]|nr:MAG: hypothetical protein DWQ30_00970 [Acidobacteriota bacterium]